MNNALKTKIKGKIGKLKQPQSAGKIYVAEPWASLLVTGKKEIETAHMRLPAQ
jgi:hypothetical protein